MKRTFLLGVLALVVLSLVVAGAWGSDNDVPGFVRPATVWLHEYDAREDATLEPALLEIFGALPGDIYVENKLLHLPEDVAPAKGDIIICIDLTGSMVGELNNVKNNSINIMNAIQALIPDTQFAVISHMDYIGEHAGCGYSATYGTAADGDYPYSLDQGLTDDTAAVAAALSGLVLGYGNDSPENYTRVLYESYADPAVGWRPGAKRIILQWGDNRPHDCAVDACLGGSTTSGPDPGRDEIDNNGDDLEILPVLNDLALEDITLLPLHSGSYLDLWDCYAAITGGEAFEINSDGTIPGGIDIADFIAGIIGDVVTHIDVMTLEVCTPGYEDWLVGLDPTEYTDLTLDVPHDLEFEVTFQVPDPMLPDLYCFDVCAMGDGVEYARQTVCIEIVEPVTYALDIKPTSCPNPLNVKVVGVLPVAILGGEDADVMEIDPETVALEGVEPIMYAYEDVAAPIEDPEWCECTTDGPDGFTDMTLKFATQEIVAALGDVTNGETRELTLTAETYGGDTVEITDCMWILARGKQLEMDMELQAPVPDPEGKTTKEQSWGTIKALYR